MEVEAGAVGGASRTCAPAGGERGEHDACGVGAGAVAHDGAAGRGVRHGAVRADAGRRAIGSIAGLVHQHVAGADEGSADGRGGEREGDACAAGGIDASRACAAGAGAALQRGAGADAAVHVAAELSVQQAEGRGRAYCRRRRIARRARANQLSIEHDRG
ncbi:hypothetical protein Y049_6158 [Burkholderia pseudomallei MSHR684]|nr:hypothetical protein Y049_6158 [Burkholderia pseudomallei MSHR684]